MKKQKLENLFTGLKYKGKFVILQVKLVKGFICLLASSSL